MNSACSATYSVHDSTRDDLWAGVGRSLLKRIESPRSLENWKSILLRTWTLPRPFPASGTYLFKASYEPGPDDTERASSEGESWLLLPLPPGGASGKEATCLPIPHFGTLG